MGSQRRSCIQITIEAAEAAFFELSPEEKKKYGMPETYIQGFRGSETGSVWHGSLDYTPTRDHILSSGLMQCQVSSLYSFSMLFIRSIQVQTTNIKTHEYEHDSHVGQWDMA